MRGLIRQQVQKGGGGGVLFPPRLRPLRLRRRGQFEIKSFSDTQNAPKLSLAHSAARERERRPVLERGLILAWTDGRTDRQVR